MPNYSLVKGDPISVGQVQFNRAGKNSHDHVRLNTDSGIFEVAMNIQSEDGSEVLYAIDHAFVPPAQAALLEAASDKTELPSASRMWFGRVGSRTFLAREASYGRKNGCRLLE